MSVKKDWFPSLQAHELDSLARRFSEARSELNHQVVRFLRVTLAETARKVSYQQPGEFKRQLICEEDREHHKPDVTTIFHELLEQNLKAMEDYWADVSKQYTTDVKFADARDRDILEVNSVDAIITSPPYGDHSTTVEYGQFSRGQMVAATPFSEEQMRQVDNNGLGGAGIQLPRLILNRPITGQSRCRRQLPRLRISMDAVQMHWNSLRTMQNA